MPSEPYDPDGQGALGVLGFLRRGGDRVEAHVGEEHCRRPPHDPRETVAAELARVRGDEGLPVLHAHVGDTHGHEEHYYRTLITTITAFRFVDSRLPARGQTPA